LIQKFPSTPDDPLDPDVPLNPDDPLDPENPLDPDVRTCQPCIPTADQVPEPPVVIRSIEPSPVLYTT
jgi:hypothetical protein